MDVITIESASFKEIMDKLSVISDFVLSYQVKENGNEDDIWVDSLDVCHFLNISKRTLQRLRASGEVAYSTIRGQKFYKIGEIKRLLENRLIKTNKECIDNMIMSSRKAQERRQILRNKI